MRLPSMTPEERAELVPDLDAVEFKRMWREAPDGGGMIFVVGHVGSNDAVAAAIARHDMPISVVADDSAFPGAVRAPAQPARVLGREHHRLAQPARDLRRAPPARDARVCSWTGATAPTGSR